MARVLLCLVAMVLGCQGCQGRDDLDGRRRPIAGLSERSSEYALIQGEREVALDLFDNRAAAVVHAAGALMIECTNADMVKYIDGNFQTSWHLGAYAGGQRAALIGGLGGEVYMPVDRDPGGIGRASDGSVTISLYARAAKPRQLVSVFLNENRLGDISMPAAEWKTYTIRAPAEAVVEGENKLRVYFRHTGEIEGVRTAAAIARVGVGSAAVMEGPALRAASVVRDKKRLSALALDSAGRLSFYLRVPEGAPKLVFAATTAAEKPAAGESSAISVGIRGSRGSYRTLYEGPIDSTWKQAEVDLADFAGDVVRLDLVSTSGAAWGRPQLIVDADKRADTGLRVSSPADHVIVWVISALRADRFAGSEVPTPAFASLLERGVLAERAYTVAPIPGAAHVAILAGIYPETATVPDSAATLGQRFSEAGYTTALVSGNGFVHDEAGFARGFAAYQNPMRRRHPFRARSLWQHARAVLQKHKDERTFLYIVTVEPHLPYNPSSASLSAEWSSGAMRFGPTDTVALSDAVAAGTEVLTRDERTYIQALYDATIRDADAAFAEMVEDLRELGVAERTALVVVSDHGEEMWERGSFGHGRRLYDEELHVPLVLSAPGLTGPRRITEDVSLIDLYPTVLALGGIAAGPESQGRSLVGSEHLLMPQPIFSHLPGYGRSLKLGQYKLIVPERGGYELYDLHRDGGERENLAGQAPLVERYMRNVFGIGVAYQSAWNRRRWGMANRMTPAFAADHGL